MEDCTISREHTEHLAVGSMPLQSQLPTHWNRRMYFQRPNRLCNQDEYSVAKMTCLW